MKKFLLIITIIAMIMPFLYVFLSEYTKKEYNIVYENLGINFRDDKYLDIKNKYGNPLNIYKKTNDYDCLYFLEYDGILIILKSSVSDININKAHIKRIIIKTKKYSINEFYVGKNMKTYKTDANNNYIFFYDSIVLQIFVDENGCISEMELRLRWDI